jgi:hypothetical protein
MPPIASIVNPSIVNPSGVNPLGDILWRMGSLSMASQGYITIAVHGML